MRPARPLVSIPKGALLPCVVQHADTGRVLMLAYMDTEALEATIETGLGHFHSRSRDRLWKKGETSGNLLEVTSLAADCDADAILMLARPAGPTCHTGADSCFESPGPALCDLAETIAERARAPRTAAPTWPPCSPRRATPVSGRWARRRSRRCSPSRGATISCRRSPTCGSTPWCSWPGTDGIRSPLWPNWGGGGAIPLCERDWKTMGGAHVSLDTIRMVKYPWRAGTIRPAAQPFSGRKVA